VTLLVLDVMLICKLLRLGGILHLVKIDACILLHRIHHGNALKRLGEIHGMLPVGQHLGTGHFLCHIAVKVLSQIHHAVVIGICLIQLHECELRIVSGVQTLITEYAANLIDTLHAADNQSL